MSSVATCPKIVMCACNRKGECSDGSGYKFDDATVRHYDIYTESARSIRVSSAERGVNEASNGSGKLLVD